MEKEIEYCGFATLDELKEAYLALQEKVAEMESSAPVASEDVTEPEPAVVESPESEILPMYEKEGWADKVKAFTAEIPVAREYGKQIAGIIVGDTELAKHPACLERALISVLVNECNKSTVEPDVKEIALQDPEIKDAVIREYVASLQKKLPRQISGGGATVVTPPRAPKTLKEATKLIRQLYK